MRNKEHIAATNHLCQINDLGSPGNTLVGNYCPFLGGSGMGNLCELEKLIVETGEEGSGVKRYRCIPSHRGYRQRRDKSLLNYC